MSRSLGDGGGRDDRGAVNAPPNRNDRWLPSQSLVSHGLLSLAVPWGIRSVYHTQPSLLDLLIPLALVVCLGWWALADARRRRRPIPRTAQPWFFLLAVPVVPGYVIWSRGWRGMGWVVLHAFLWYALATVALHLGGLMVYGGAWLRALGL